MQFLLIIFVMINVFDFINFLNKILAYNSKQCIPN